MYFLSFYSEGEPYDEGFPLSSVAEEIQEKLTPYFDQIFLYNKRTLKTLPNSEDICNSYDEPLDQNANVHHFGYFDFKPFLIDYTLKNIPEDSLLLYHDGNFIKNQQYWQSDWENIESLSKNLLFENGTDIWFQMEREGCYVKSCVKEYTLDYFFTESEKHIVKNSHLINAARVLVRNNEFGRKFISEYLELCKNKNLIAKSPNHNPDPEFQWSCGDQDVLNCLVYRYILDGKLPKTFPRFSFLYRVLRYENRPFLWSGVNNDNYHFTGISELKNTELLTYMENLSVEITENDIISFLNPVKLSEETDLCKVLKKHGSDKSSDWHNYSPLYNYFFQHLREDEINFLEVGIYYGASVHSWREYFPNAKIFAADVDEETFRRVEGLDVDCFYCNQDDPASIQNMWNNDKLKDLHFDVIMDDGKHEFISNLNFLKESIHKLKKGGIFIVEDLTIPTFNSFENILSSLESEYSLDYMKLLKLPNPNNKIDNNILLIIK